MPQKPQHLDWPQREGEALSLQALAERAQRAWLLEGPLAAVMPPSNIATLHRNPRPLQLEVLCKLRSSTQTAVEGPRALGRSSSKDHLFSGNWEHVPAVT